jgi:hypothetical protein
MISENDELMSFEVSDEQLRWFFVVNLDGFVMIDEFGRFWNVLGFWMMMILRWLVVAVTVSYGGF